MRIVSLAPSNTEILYALGAGEEIVAVCAFCTYPPLAKTKPKVGGWTTANVKMVKKFKPDLVITSTFLQDPVVRDLKKLNINVLHLDPRTLDQVFESIIILGGVVKKTKQAKQLVLSMKAEMQRAQNKLKKAARKIKVYIEEWHKPPMVSGNWVPALAKFAAAQYFPINEGEISREITLDEIQKFDPEIVILSLCGYGKRPSPDIIYRRKGWENISAVKNKKVYVFDDDLLNRPGPRLVEGLKQLVTIVYG